MRFAFHQFVILFLVQVFFVWHVCFDCNSVTQSLNAETPSPAFAPLTTSSKPPKSVKPSRKPQSTAIRLPVIKDNSIVLVDREWNLNAGANGRIRIKGNQHIIAMQFDIKAIIGKRIRRATLVCVPSAEKISGVTISTIATPWDEMKSNGMTAGIDNVEGWGYANARFPAVCGGNAFTLTANVATEMKDGFYHWRIPPDMLYALATKTAFGLAIHEHDADYGRNPTIFSREQSGKQPYLIVELDDTIKDLANTEDSTKDNRSIIDASKKAPPPPTDLKLVVVDSTSALLKLRAPESGFAYEVSIDGHVLGRHNIPLVTPGKQESIWLRDLPDTIAQSGTHAVHVRVLNRIGVRSKPVSVRGELFQSTNVPFPTVTWPVAKDPIPGVAVIPVTDKYDVKGNPVGALPENYRVHNSIFDGQTIRLNAMAGEVLGIQILLRGKEAVVVEPRLDDPPLRIDLFQAIYVPAEGRLIPDPLLPLPSKVTLATDADQAIFADIYIPFDSKSGVRKGTIVISDGRKIPFEISILPVAFPKKATFLCEMNSYGLPDHVDDYYALQQIAYDHRVHANILHYSHHTAAPGARKSNLDMRLPSGRRMDNARYDSVKAGDRQAFWDDFVAAFGPFLDGTCFEEGHRGPIPAPGFYLTFHESWPLNCRAYFNGELDAYRAFEASPEYAETYVNIVADFVRLAKENGWDQTGFQIYFNNKGSLNQKSKAPWILDEPSAYWDYRALQYYGELTDRGHADANDVQIDYRIDISRPEFCRGQLSNRSDFWVVSSWAFQHYRRLVTDRMERDRLKVWVYGSSNHVHQSNRDIQSWCLDAWRDGATGVVPWQTVDKSGKALKQADQLGLFIFDKDTRGKTVIRHSARLKAFRETQQLIEALNLLRKQRHWTADQTRRFVDHYVTLNGRVKKVNDDDAGTTAYTHSTPRAIETLKMATIELLRNPRK